MKKTQSLIKEIPIKFFIDKEELTPMSYEIIDNGSRVDLILKFEITDDYKYHYPEQRVDVLINSRSQVLKFIGSIYETRISGKSPIETITIHGTKASWKKEEIKNG